MSDGPGHAFFAASRFGVDDLPGLNLPFATRSLHNARNVSPAIMLANGAFGRFDHEPLLGVARGGRPLRLRCAT